MARDRLYGWLVIVSASLAVAFALLWQQERRRVEAYRDATDCSKILREVSPAYAGVTVGVTSHPSAIVQGTVGSEAERDRLDKALSERLGGERRSRVRFGVRVEDRASGTRPSP